MPNRNTLYYTYLIHESSFVRKDFGIFKKKFDVIECHFVTKNKKLLPLAFLKQFWNILVNLRKIDCFITQFSGYQSFLPGLFSRITGKPSLIIAGGTDCVSFPSIDYGNFNRFWMRAFTKWSYQLSSHISPVSQSLVLYDYTYQDADFPKQGVLYFMPRLKTPFTVIHNGYDADKWYCNSPKKKKTFITAMGAIRRFTIELKGIDLIIGVAPYFPDCEFQLLGVPDHQRLKDLPPNVVQFPLIPHGELINYYSRAEFYMQLSMSEGFPNALSEAMLCECVPIVSNVGAMPEMVQDRENGFILKRRDVLQLKQLIETALESDREALAKKARNKIQSTYSELKREQQLLDLLTKLCAK